MKWEYASVVIGYNKKRGGWVVDGSGVEAPMGLQPVLDWYGQFRMPDASKTVSTVSATK